MTERHYWVRIRKGGRPLGAGFLLTQEFVLTAMHCVRELSSDDCRAELELPDGRLIPGRLCDSVKGADLALIAVDDARSHELPLAPKTDWPRPNTRWRVTYCPPGESTQLSGYVTHEPVDYPSLAGGGFKGVQLTVEQELGTYAGYSGSPVDTDPKRPVVGILMEEQRSREDPNRGSNVLFAASVQHAMDQFPQFRVHRLRDWILAAEPPSSGSASDDSDTAPDWIPAHEADVLLKRLKQWEEGGYITAAEAAEQRRRTLQRLGDLALGGDLDERG
ncbi:S1 family peptidase [Streptomyces sp. SD15]